MKVAHAPRRCSSRFGALALIASLGVVLGLFACAAEETSGPPPLATGSGSTTRRDAGSGIDDEPLEASVLDVANTPGATTYKGMLAASKTVTFGGSGYCGYKVTLKEIEIEVAILATGDVIASTAKDLVVEETIAPCTFPPMTPARQTFSFATATPTTNGQRLTYAGGGTNQPKTSLLVDIVRSGSVYTATATWHRTDQQAPLDWLVTAQVPLVPPP